MKFNGQVSSRSSKVSNPTSTLPGEADIIKCNPDRSKKLLELGNWDRLEEGTLNLEVAPEVIELLKRMPGNWYESPESIIPPRPNYKAHINRGGYKYFKCTVCKSTESCDAILRIGAINPLKKRVELYSDVKLRTYFDVADGDWLCININSE